MIRIVFIIYICVFINSQASVLHDKLSSEEHFTDKNNDQKLEHNDEFDHEVFLGKKEANKFKELNEEESLKELGFIFDKIDVNNDSLVIEEELYSWIQNINNLSIDEEIEKRWKLYDPDRKGFITIETILKINYDALNYCNYDYLKIFH
jgi:Ca2+-binding EF-hand superfamily protein